MKAACCLVILCLFPITLIASEANEVVKDEAVIAEVKFEDIQLPKTNSSEYWVVRSEAIGDLTRLLTKKRAEMKQKRQMLSDFLLKIGKAEEMSSAKIEVPDDPNLYAMALGILDGLEQRDIPLPKNLPTWEELVEFAMRFVLYEGFVPMEFDGDEDVQKFIEVCKKKEEYAQKVRKDMRAYVNDCLKMWIYLGTIDQQSACKEWAVEMKQNAEKERAAERAAAVQERRTAALARQEEERQKKFADAENRRQARWNNRYTSDYRW